MSKRKEETLKNEETKPDTYTLLEKIVSMVKKEVAEEYGFTEAIIGNTNWEFAMIITYRTKKQIEMYERLCMKLALYCC